MGEPLKPKEAKAQIRRLLSEGRIVYSIPHARERLQERNISNLDCENVLRGGKVEMAHREATMKCFECEKGKMTTSNDAYRYYECGLPNVILIGVSVHRCKYCGAEYVSIPDMEGLHRALAMAVVNKDGRLTPHEVRFLRKSLGWSGADFARKFHVTPSAVSRWESTRLASPMSKANELRLRDMVAHGMKIDDYEKHMEEISLEDLEALSLSLVHSSDGWSKAA